MRYLVVKAELPYMKTQTYAAFRDNVGHIWTYDREHASDFTRIDAAECIRHCLLHGEIAAYWLEPVD